VVRGHLKTIYYFLEYQSQIIILEVQDYSKINKNKNDQNPKPCFDQDGKFARQTYRKSKRRYKLNNTIRNHDRRCFPEMFGIIS
jgi:hypothetical protein